MKLIVTLSFMALFIMPAFSQIIYTDINPDSVLVSTWDKPMYYDFSMDNKGNNDFTIAHHVDIQFFSGYNGSLVLVDENNNNVPIILNAGDSITPDKKTWYNSGCMSLNMSNNWPGNIDKYIGLKFKRSGKWHYGWLNISIPADAQSCIVKGYAYENTPGKGLKAGDTGNNTSVYKMNQDIISVYPNPAYDYIIITGLTNVKNIQIINSMGNIVSVVKIEKEKELIDISCFTNGIYYIKFSNAIHRFVVNK